MDIFDRLEFDQKRIESTPSKLPSSPPPKHSTENVRESLFSPSSDSENPKKPEISLLPTAILPTETRNLVWAPYYRYSNALFCARKCSEEEALSEKTIPWPISEGEMVVEIFCQEVNSKTTQLLLVKSSKVIPYYALSSKDSRKGQIDNSKWNEANVQKMKKALEEKNSKKVAEVIHSTIMRTAQEILRVSLEQEKQFNELIASSAPSEEKFDLPSPSPSKTKNLHLLKYQLVRSKEPLPLSIGDRICYRQKLTGSECESLVEEFLEHHKIMVSNGDVLSGEDLICRMILSEDAPKSSSQKQRSYEKEKTGFQEVNNFQFVGASSAASSKRKRPATKAAVSEVTVTEVPAPRKKKAKNTST